MERKRYTIIRPTYTSERYQLIETVGDISTVIMKRDDEDEILKAMAECQYVEMIKRREFTLQANAHIRETLRYAKRHNISELRKHCKLALK